MYHILLRRSKKIGLLDFIWNLLRWMLRRGIHAFFTVNVNFCSRMHAKIFATMQWRSAASFSERQIYHLKITAPLATCTNKRPLRTVIRWSCLTSNIKWFRCVNPGCLNCSAWLNDGHRSKLADNYFNVNKTVPHSVRVASLYRVSACSWRVLCFFYQFVYVLRVCIYVSTCVLLNLIACPNCYIDILDIVRYYYHLYPIYILCFIIVLSI